MGAVLWSGVTVLVMGLVFELPHHMPRAHLLPCRKIEAANGHLNAASGLCVASPQPPTSLLQFISEMYAQQDLEPELEYFACSELLRSLPCTLPTRREHIGRNCFNRRPKGELLLPVSAQGGSGPGGREWDWQPKVGEYIDSSGDEEEAQLTFSVGTSDEPGQEQRDSFRWTRVPAWASLWHKPWAKLKLMLGNEDGGSSEMEVLRSSLGCE